MNAKNKLFDYVTGIEIGETNIENLVVGEFLIKGKQRFKIIEIDGLDVFISKT